MLYNITHSIILYLLIISIVLRRVPPGRTLWQRVAALDLLAHIARRAVKMRSTAFISTNSDNRMWSCVAPSDYENLLSNQTYDVFLPKTAAKPDLQRTQLKEL